MIQRLKHFLFYRHLLWEFLRRDLQARYVGSVMGFFWSVINPLILLGIYTTVFGLIFDVRIDRFGEKKTIDFAFYIFSGMLPWYAFQESLIRCTTCIVDNNHLIKQMRFPAKVLPAYIVLSSVVNQCIGTALLLVVMFFCHVFQFSHSSLHATLFGFPLILFMQIVFMFGTGLLFATLNTYIRDVAPLVSTLMMILMWASPMFYQIQDDFPTTITTILYANPITYLVIINHDLMLFGEWPSWSTWMIFSGFVFFTFLLGYWIFTRCHKEFSDLI